MNRLRLYLLKRRTLKQLDRKMIVLPPSVLLRKSDIPEIARWIKEASQK